MNDSRNTPIPEKAPGIPVRELLIAWRDAGLMFVFSALIALGFNTLRPHGLPLIRYAPFDLLGDCPEVLEDIVRIQVEKLRPGDPNVVYLDVRTAADFVQGHIPGAWFTPMYETAPVEEVLVQRLRELKKGTWIVVVGDKNALTAERMITSLSQSGIRGLFVLEGGLPAWTRLHPKLQPVKIPVMDVLTPGGRVQIVDADDEDAFAAGHLPGAVSLPYDDLLPPDPETLERLRQAGDLPIVVVARTPLPEPMFGDDPIHPGAGVAADLAARGFQKVSVLRIAITPSQDTPQKEAP